METTLFILFGLVILFFILTQCKIQQENYLDDVKLNNEQIYDLNRINADYSRSDHQDYYKMNELAEKIGIKYPDVVCSAPVDELAFNDTIVCQGRFSPYVSHCEEIGKDLNKNSYKSMQDTVCVIDINKDQL